MRLVSRHLAKVYLYVCVADSVGCIAKHSSCVFGKPYKCTNLGPVRRSVCAVDLRKILRTMGFKSI